MSNWYVIIYHNPNNTLINNNTKHNPLKLRKYGTAELQKKKYMWVHHPANSFGYTHTSD